jgi:hypothetical protein
MVASGMIADHVGDRRSLFVAPLSILYLGCGSGRYGIIDYMICRSDYNFIAQCFRALNRGSIAWKSSSSRRTDEAG